MFAGEFDTGGEVGAAVRHRSHHSQPKRTRLINMKKLFRAIGMTLLCAGSAHAGSAFFDFNSDPSASGLLTNYGNAAWSPVDGAGTATNANDGYLVITGGS